jgi:SulP family sulfate permease
VFGTFKLGKYITLMPYSVISGFMSGIGVILIILQIAPFLGQAAPKGGVLGTVMAIPQLIANVNPPEAILGALTLAIIFFMPKQLKKVVPPQLVALIIGTVISLTLFQGVEIRRIGEIPVGLPPLQLPTFSPDQLTVMLVDGVMLGMLGCIDTLLTAVVADSLTRTEHNSNKELVGQGIGNIVSGLCGGLPGAGATMGTVVNIQTGATSAVSGLTRALVVLGATRLTQPIPMAVLAGIALKVGIDILDWSFLKRSHKVSLKGSLIMYGVLLLTVFVDLIVAVGVGVFVANILTIERLSEMQSSEVKLISDLDDDVNLSQEQRQLLDKAKGRVLLFCLSGPMIFGLSKAIAREHNAMKEADALVVDLTQVPSIGVTASLAIENVIRDAHDKGLQVYVVGASAKIQHRLQKLGLFDLIHPEHVLSDRTTALQNAVDQLQFKGAIT